jgi:hypothetical protein
MAIDPARRPANAAPAITALDGFMLVCVFVPVFECFGFFRHSISVMQLWILYSTKTSRRFFAPKWALDFSVDLGLASPGSARLLSET